MDNIKEEMQMAGFQIIAAVGVAKSCYMEAIQIAKEGNIEEAFLKIEEGREIYGEAHSHHHALITKESQGVDLPFSLILMHAEDQLLTTEVIQLMASEFVELYQKTSKNL